MINYILDLLAANATEIGTFLFTSLLAWLKRFLDKKKIRYELIARGMDEQDVKRIV